MGDDVLTGALAAADTTPVCAETAEPEPAELLAVTAARSVDPTSAAASAYVCPVAPAISAQFAPPLSHRRH